MMTSEEIITRQYTLLSNLSSVLSEATELLNSSVATLDDSDFALHHFAPLAQARLGVVYARVLTARDTVTNAMLVIATIRDGLEVKEDA